MRKNWDSYFLDIAFLVATRSTCTRKKVGAVIVSPTTRSIISAGYNGSLPKAAHCDEHGCFLVNNHCSRTIHAETNAINQAAKNGNSLLNAHIYCTTKPCWNCFKNIIQSGITGIFFREDYIDASSVLYEEYLSDNPHVIYKKL